MEKEMFLSISNESPEKCVLESSSNFMQWQRNGEWSGKLTFKMCIKRIPTQFVHIYRVKRKKEPFHFETLNGFHGLHITFEM